MAIADFYNKTVTIKRFATTTGAKKGLSDIATDVPVHIQPLDASFVENTEYILGKDYQMFCGITDLQEGDRILVDSDEYKVIGVEKYSLGFSASQDHVEAIIRIFDQT